MSDLPGLPVEPAEPVPAQLRILAMMQNLGTLHSIHRPASRLANLQYRNGRIYLFDQGFVLGLPGDRLGLFRWGQITVRKGGSGYLVIGADGRRMGLSRKWTGFAELEQAIIAGVAAGVATDTGSSADAGTSSGTDSSAGSGTDSTTGSGPDSNAVPGT